METLKHMPKTLSRASANGSDIPYIELSYSNQRLKIKRLLEKRYIQGLDKIDTMLKNNRAAFRAYVEKSDEFYSRDLNLYKNEMRKTDRLLKLYHEKFYQ